MDQTTLQAERRPGIGTRSSRKLRSEGRLPGIIYGHGEEPVAFSVNRHDAEVELQHGHHLINLTLDGKSESYLIKGVQHNHLGSEVIHLDLARVDLDETVEVMVAVVLKGVARGISEGGVLDHVIPELKVSCKASDIPAEIRVNVSDLGIGQTITVRNLTLPDGVSALTDADAVVAAVRVITEAPEGETEPGAEAAEPELISRAKESAEDEGE